jgi:hypothetical protein
MRSVLIIATASLLGTLTVFASAQPAPTTAPGKAAIDATFQSLVEIVPADPADSELQAKLKERHNAAAKLLGFRLEEYHRGMRDMSGVLEAARLAVDTKLDLAATAQERQRILEQTVEVAKSFEQVTERQVKMGVAPNSDLERARFARLSAEVMLLKAKQPPATTQSAP